MVLRDNELSEIRNSGDIKRGNVDYRHYIKNINNDF